MRTLFKMPERATKADDKKALAGGKRKQAAPFSIAASI